MKKLINKFMAMLLVLLTLTGVLSTDISIYAEDDTTYEDDEYVDDYSDYYSPGPQIDPCLLYTSRCV